MKVKELQKTVNVAWSPTQQNPILLAAGTAAQQLDSANANAVLEIYSTNLGEPGYDLELKASHPSKYRFQKIVWSPTGYNGTHPNGLIVGGCEGGHLQIYSAANLLSNKEALIAQQDKHTGPIRGLDFNPFQHNLLASVASESEILIWDLNNTTTPMTPGTKTQPLEDVQNVAWNKQVQHILASVFSSRCVIWDLRKNEQIIKLSDTQSRVRWRALSWHPDIATQLWLASEEDQAPFVQLWDLRYATAPAKTLQIHQRGILGLTWCPKDSDLMVSCGKDNKIYCWNPNSEIAGGEILSEVATTIQWYSDIQWCPRNPALIASSSLEGNVSIYSLLGGSQQQVQTSNKIADSFPGMDQFAQAPIQNQATTTVYSDLKKPPKWMKKPAGASFGFGGRLFAFNLSQPRAVTISQVITEPELVKRSNELESTLAGGNFSEYCRQKADQMPDQHGRYLWYFIRANFEANPRAEMLNLLGYDANDMANKFNKYAEDGQKADETAVEQLTNQMATLSRSDSSEVEGDQSTDDSTDLSGGDNNALFDAIAAGSKALSEKNLNENLEYKIKTGEDDDGLICQSILSGNIEAAVELCMKFGKTTEAIIIAITGGSDLLARTQYRYLKKTDGYLSNIISALVTQDWTTVVSQCSVESWKEALVAALTHSQGQMEILCEKLGERLQLESDKDPSLSKNALLCYICSGNIEKLVEAWTALKKEKNIKLTTSELQEHVEIIMLLQKSLELQGRQVQLSGKLADFLVKYAGLLASQGALESALSYLGPSNDPEISGFRLRLQYALGRQQTNIRQSQPHNFFNQQSTAPTNRLLQQRNSISSSFNTGLPGAYKPNPPAAQINNPWNANPVQQTPSVFNPIQPLSTGTVPPFLQPAQPVLSKPPSGPPPAINDNMSQPPRPTSVGSQGRTTPLTTRNKYVLDPSVASGPNYSQTVYNPPQATVFNNPLSSRQPQQQFSSSGLNSNSIPSYPSTQQQNNFGGNSTPNSFKPFVPTQSTMPLPHLTNSSSSFMGGIPPIELAQPAMPPPPPMQKNPTPPPGWNDPPALRSNRQQAQQENSGSVAPITHPLFGVEPNKSQNGYPEMNMGYQNNQYQPPLPPQQQHPDQLMYQPQMQSQQQPQNFPNPMNFQTQSVSQVYQHHHEAPAPPIPEPPQPKPPIPEEFIYMQTVFEELKNQCLNVASDPRTKRKFADVTKRLECLYDLLRDRRLTPGTLSALNQIVQYLQINDYQNAIATHTSIVSGPDFSQTANFMPGIKVLIQSAIELKVCLR